MQDYLVSYRTLYSIFQNKAFASLELSNNLSEASNKEFVTKLVYGVLEKNVELEYYISQLTSKKPKAPIYIILKMGMYCIKYMDSIPSYAIVNKLVDLTAKIGKMELKGFVNATLKKFVTWKGVLPSDEIEALSVSTSTPLWLVKEYIEQYGLSTAKQILKPSTYVYEHIRINSRTYSMKELLGVMSEFKLKYDESTSNAIYTKYKKIMKELYAQGKITVQSRTSMIACEEMDLKDGDIVLDLCAAPGGKSVYLSEIKDVQIVSCDIYDHRLELINSYINRMQAKGIEVLKNDATIYNEAFDSRFDKVLCDVPCSGLGVKDRKPDVYLGINKEDILSLANIQFKILSNASKYVKKGGILVYSTCTILKQENSDIIKKFMQEHNEEFELLKETQYLPNGKGQDGFYIAKLKKK